MRYERLQELYDLPFFDLLDEARRVHQAYWPRGDVQLATLLSIKTGLCPEDCGYCSQSVHNQTDLTTVPLMSVAEVRRKAEAARDAGASRFCMGAGWREPKNDADFDQVLEMVRDVRSMGMEACVTLGMLDDDQAQRLKEAGLTSYNHNIDTSAEFYGEIITTRTFEDRLQTIDRVNRAGIGVCAGGILGLGEAIGDRLKMLEVLSELDPQPTSVPINRLVPIAGTPLQDREPVDAFEMARIIAIARISMPRARVRLSAGRESLSDEAQALCFLAGANSIFYGGELLTTSNKEAEADLRLLEKLGLDPRHQERQQERQQEHQQGYQQGRPAER